MVLFEDYNIKPEDLEDKIRFGYDANLEFYKSLLVQCVLSKENNVYRNYLTLIKPIVTDNEKDEGVQADLKYGGFILNENKFKIDELFRLVTELSEGKLNLGKRTFTLKKEREFWRKRFLPSGNEYMTYPGLLFEMEMPKASLDSTPLLDYKLPFYEDVYEAIKDRTGLKDFRGSNDDRLGKVLIFIPECRAYFDSIVLKNEIAIPSVKVNDDNFSDLMIKGMYSCAGEIHRFEQSISDGDIQIPISPEIEKIELYLIGKENRVFDYHKESRFWSIGQHPIIATEITRNDGEIALLKALESGEGPNTEFKPFIEIGNKKENELVNTAIAFANSKGGRIFIGIDDNCLVEGIERGIEKLARKKNIEIDIAIKKYIGHLRQIINRDLTKEIDLEIKSVLIAPHILVVITILEGSKKPYSHRYKKEIFVRKGANSVRADPEHDLPELFNKMRGLV